MRVWIIALSVLAIFPGIFVGAGVANAGPSATPRAALAPVDPVTLTDDATPEPRIKSVSTSNSVATCNAG